MFAVDALLKSLGVTPEMVAYAKTLSPEMFHQFFQQIALERQFLRDKLETIERQNNEILALLRHDNPVVAQLSEANHGG